MASTAAELLAVYDEAILALVRGGASSYSIGGRTVTKLNLRDLEKRRDELALQVERESGGGIFRKATIRRPSP